MIFFPYVVLLSSPFIYVLFYSYYITLTYLAEKP